MCYWETWVYLENIFYGCSPVSVSLLHPIMWAILLQVILLLNSLYHSRTRNNKASDQRVKVLNHLDIVTKFWLNPWIVSHRETHQKETAISWGAVTEANPTPLWRPSSLQLLQTTYIGSEREKSLTLLSLSIIYLVAHSHHHLIITRLLLSLLYKQQRLIFLCITRA